MLRKSKKLLGAKHHSVTCFILSAIVSGSISTVSANPKNGVVKAGSATINNVSASQMVIDQTTSRAAIDWESFSIGRGEAVNINQPTTSSTILNRVTGAKLSDIRGQLNANGNVFLVNPNGIVLGKGALIDVNSLVATTANIKIEDFMADRFEFTGSGNGKVVNNGEISVAENGLVALVAPTVVNTGIIRAKLGRVALASGNKFTVDLYGDGLVSLALKDDLTQSLINHSGQILAEGGSVALTTSAAKSVVDSVINMDGIISAQSATEKNGKIVLHGGPQGQVLVSGKMDTSGEAGGKGGLVEVLGKNIVLESDAEVLANGPAGGGEIYIGGDFQGVGDRLKADSTDFRIGAKLAADATSQGDGGTVVLWSQINTQADGFISAVGGPLGGNGGMVETSSAGQLSFTSQVDVRALAGQPGTWLIDPEDITIGRGEADSIEATLNDGGSVSIATSSEGSGKGDITVAASITKTEGGDAALALTAHNDVNVNAPITSQSGELDVNLTAGNSINVNAPVATNGGSFTSHIKPQLAQIAESAENEAADVSADTGTNEETAELVAEADEAAAEPQAIASEISTQQDVAEADEAATEPQSIAGEISTQLVVVDSAVATNGGQVVIDANTTGSVSVNGQLDTTNSAAGQTGGDVFVTGETVRLSSDALVDSSGDAGGGRILIGGGFQGDGEIASAQQTTIDGGAQIVANANNEGNAGQVVVWSDGTTEFNGSISANGGTVSGDGGQVEVSGKQVLKFNGFVDATAVEGNNGSLLLDPTTLTIVSNPAQIENNPGAPGIPDMSQEVSVLSWEQIQNLGDIDLLIRTGENLNFAAMDGGEVRLPQSADMASARTIAFLSDNGNIVFVKKTDTLRTSGGDLQFGAPNGNLELGVLITENPDSLDGGIGGTPKVFANYTPGGSITLRSGGDISVDRIETMGGSLRATAGGNFVAGGLGSTAMASNKAAVNLAVNTPQELMKIESTAISGEMIIDADSISMIGNEYLPYGLVGGLPEVASSDPPTPLPTTTFSGITYSVGAVSRRFDLTANKDIYGVYSFPNYANGLIEDLGKKAGLAIDLNGYTVDHNATYIRNLIINDLALRKDIGPDRDNLPGKAKIFGSELMIPGLSNTFLFYNNPRSTSTSPVSPAIGFKGTDLLAPAPPLTTVSTPPVFVSSGTTPTSITAPVTGTEQVIPVIRTTLNVISSPTSTTQSELIEIEQYAGTDNADPCERSNSNYLAWLGYAVNSAIDVAYMGRKDPAGAIDSVFNSNNCF